MSKLKAKLKIESYIPDTEYVQGRIFFGEKGVYSNVKIHGFLKPMINLINQMNIKYISWKVVNQPIPDILYPYIKPKKLEMLKQRQENTIKSATITYTGPSAIPTVIPTVTQKNKN